MQELYSEKDSQLISEQLKKRYLFLGGVLAVLLALVIWSVSVRMEWLSVVALFLLCATAFFVIDLFCIPLHRYQKLLRSALTGRTHVETLEYAGAEAENSVVDGVTCRGLIFLGNPDRHGSREQRFYWDAEHPLPDFRTGDQVTLKYTGRNIIGYQM